MGTSSTPRSGLALAAGALLCGLAHAGTAEYSNLPKVPQPTDAQRSAFATVKLAQIEMVYEAEGQQGLEHTSIQPLTDTFKTAGITRYMDMSRTPGDPDVQIRIQFEGDAICPTYERIGASCTGAEVEGVISFERPDGSTYKVPFEGSFGGGMYTRQKIAARDAPFSAALAAEGSLYDSLLEALVALRGDEVLANAWNNTSGSGSPMGRWLETHLKRRGAEATDFLIARMGKNRRAEALLATIGDPRAIPAMSARLDQVSGYDRAWLIEKLVLFDDPAIEALLIRALDDAHGAVRRNAVDAIAKRRVVAAVPKLMAIASQPVPEARRDEEVERECASRGLSAAAGIDCRNVLRKEVDHLRALESTRYRAIEALGQLDAKSAADMLDSLAASEPKMKRTAALALADLGDPRAAAHLVEILKLRRSNPNQPGHLYVQDVARLLRALGKAPTRAGVEELLGRISDEADDQFKGVAAEALGQISGKNYGKSERRWRAWWKENSTRFPE